MKYRWKYWYTNRDT